MGQSNAMVRFLAKSFKGKDGTVFYPGPSDPMKSYWIDQWVDKNDGFFMEHANFVIPLMAGYKEKDKHFVNFITTQLPKRLQNFEDFNDYLHLR